MELLSRAWARSRSKGVARLVVLDLADSAGVDDTATLDIERLAEKANATPREVNDALEELIELGELVHAYDDRYTVRIAEHA